MNARAMLEHHSALIARYEGLQAQATACKRKAGSGPLAERVQRLQQQAQEAARKLRANEARLSRLLAKLPDGAQRQVLSLRYLGGHSYAEISLALDFSTRHIYRLHLAGVAALDLALAQQVSKGKARAV